MNFKRINSEDAFEKAINSLGSKTRTIVCGSESNINSLKDNYEFCDDSTGDIIKRSNEVDHIEWFKSRRKEMEEEQQEFDEPFDVEGPWPGGIDDSQKMGFVLNIDFSTGQLAEDLYALELDVDNSWEVPAHLKYGDWNDCPEAEVHCVIWKHWEEKYGAKIVGVGSDVIEAYVERPPKTKEEAMELAWEQYLYCADIVDQGVETVSNLASSILNYASWYFWWD